MDETFNFHLAAVEVLGNSKEKEDSKPNVFNIRTNIIVSEPVEDVGISLSVLDNISIQAVDQIKQQFSHLIVEANNVVILNISFLGTFTKKDFGYSNDDLNKEVMVDEVNDEPKTH